MRWSEEQYADYLRRGQPPPLTEKVLQGAVIRLLKQSGYLVYFTWSSKRSPEGFPDLVCAKAGVPLLALELKTETGQVTPAQQHWLDALARVEQVRAEVVRPSTLEAFVQSLPR